MKMILLGLAVIFLFGISYSPLSFSQIQNNTIDLDSDISDIAYDLADYHYKLAVEEREKGNETGANIHANLMMMTLDQIREMVNGTLDQESKQKITRSDPGNCLVNNKGMVLCLE